MNYKNSLSVITDFHCRMGPKFCVLYLCVLCSRRCEVACGFQALSQSLELSVSQLMLMCVTECVTETVDYCAFVRISVTKRQKESQRPPSPTMKQEERGGVIVHQRRTEASLSLLLMTRGRFSTSWQRPFYRFHTP